MKQLAALTQFIFLLIVSHAAPLSGQASLTDIPPTVSNPDKEIPELMAQYRIPGAAVEFIRAGEIAYSGLFGVRSIDTRGPVDESTVFASADLSKPVFAFLVMKLAEAGTIDLDMPLYAYLENRALASQELYKLITARMVLTHTSGLPVWRSGPLNLQFTPGQGFQYSSEGFLYLMQVVEKLTGKPLDELAGELVFKPLGMSHSGFVWQDKFDKDMAYAHDYLGRALPGFRSVNAHAGVSLYTTCSDYARFVMALMDRKGLKEEGFKAFFDPQMDLLEIPEMNGKISWALGLGVQQIGDRRLYWHWGDFGNYTSYLIFDPETREGLVYLTNSSNGLDLSDDFIRMSMGIRQLPVRGLIQDPVEQAVAGLVSSLNGAEDLSKVLLPFLKQGKEALDTEKLPFEVVSRAGNGLLDLGRTQTARKLLKLNLQAHPENPAAWRDFGFACMLDGDPAEAVQAFKRTLELQPDYPEVDGLIGRLTGKAAGNTLFRLNDYPNARFVAVAGEFNQWNARSLPCVRENGSWVCPVDIKPGTYLYKFVVDGVWVLDPDNERSVHSDHYHNSQIEIK